MVACEHLMTERPLGVDFLPTRGRRSWANPLAKLVSSLGGPGSFWLVPADGNAAMDKPRCVIPIRWQHQANSKRSTGQPGINVAITCST